MTDILASVAKCPIDYEIKFCQTRSKPQEVLSYPKGTSVGRTRGFTTQDGGILVERYGYFVIEESINLTCIRSFGDAGFFTKGDKYV